MGFRYGLSCHGSIQSILDDKVRSQRLSSSLVESRRTTKPPGPTKSFTGRIDILNKLSTYFSETTASVACATQRVFVLFGMGGAGKTQIALKFVNEYRTRYVLVHVMLKINDQAYGIYADSKGSI